MSASAYRTRAEPHLNRLQMTGHALFSIIGHNVEGRFTNQWLFTSESPLDVMHEVRNYLAEYPDLTRVELMICVHDKEQGKVIRIV